MNKLCNLPLFLLIFSLLFSALFLPGCASSPPELDQIYDTVVNLIEQSYQANDILYGYGLPIIAIDSELAETYHVYSDNDSASYAYVAEESAAITVSAIKDILESVYSSDYLDTYYTSLFDGFVAGDTVYRARYYESDEWLYQSTDNQPLVTWQRVYDYSTMRLTKPSRADYVSVIIDTHMEGEEEILPITISIVYQNGAWYLDTPTY